MLSGLGRISVSLVAGFLAGIFSLSALSVAYWILIKLGADNLIDGFYVNEIIEEAVKFAVLLFLFDIFLSKVRNYNIFSVVFFSIIFGLGFSFFEAILLALSGYEPVALITSTPFFALVGLHVVASIFVGIAAASWISARTFIFSASFLIFAIILHIYYNIFALNFG